MGTGGGSEAHPGAPSGMASRSGWRCRRRPTPLDHERPTTGPNTRPERGRYPMERIDTQDGLFCWLFDRILASEPQIEVTPGLVRLGRVIRDEVLDVGCLARYDSDCW